MSNLTTAEFYETLLRLARSFEERFADKESDAYKGYQQAMSYINAGEEFLGWGPLMEYCKSGNIILSDTEKEEALAVAQFMMSVAPDDADVQEALEDTQSLIGASTKN